MKNLLILGIVAIALAVAIPAMAEDQDLYALSKLTVSPQMLTDRQLESVEGAAACGIFCSISQNNLAVVPQSNNSTQVNGALLSLARQRNTANQSNTAITLQRNR
jgi:hypothetical protein